MKKLFGLLTIIIALNLIIAPVSAETLQESISNYGNQSPINSAEQVITILKNVVGLVYRLFFILTIFFVLLAAYNFLFAQGDPNKVKLARDQLLYAAVAVAVALISTGAAAIIQSFINKQ